MSDDRTDIGGNLDGGRPAAGGVGIGDGGADAGAHTVRRRCSTATDVVRMLAPTERPPGGGEVSVYMSVGFAPGSAELPEAAKQHLGLVAEAMSAPELQRALIVVEGHTDASGDAEYNDALALARAASAAEYLLALGVARSRLALRGMGETDLLPDIDPLAPEQRRIEFVRRFDDADAESQVAVESAACNMQPVLAAHGLTVLQAQSRSHANPVFSPEGLRSVFEALEWGASGKARQLIEDYYLSPGNTDGSLPLRLTECAWRHASISDDARIHAAAMNLMLMREGIIPNPDVVRRARERAPAVDLHSIPGSGLQEWLRTINLDIEPSTDGRVKGASRAR